MRTTTSSGSRSSHELAVGMNMAQRLRGILGIRAAHGRAPVRQRRLQLEAMEPRFLLSGEALVIPPLVKAAEDAQGVISMPAQLLQTQLTSSMAGSLMDVAVRPSAEAQARAQEVIFVDPAVEGYDALVKQALRKRGGPDAAPSNVEVVVLDAASDGARVRGRHRCRRVLLSDRPDRRRDPGQSSLADRIEGSRRHPHRRRALPHPGELHEIQPLAL